MSQDTPIPLERARTPGLVEYVPQVVIIDKLGSYQEARRRIARSVEHRQPKYLISTGSGRASTGPFSPYPAHPRTSDDRACGGRST
jgi:hypothetical protein